MTVYVQREAGVVVGIYANPQPVAEEAIDDQHPDVLAYTTPSAEVLYQRLKDAAVAFFQQQDNMIARALRAVLPVIRTEFNRHRKRAREQNAAVAAATSLADLKSRWAIVATNNPAPDLSVDDVRDAIIAAINRTDSD